MRKMAVRMMMPRMAPAFSTASFLAMLIDCVKFMVVSSLNDPFCEASMARSAEKEKALRGGP